MNWYCFENEGELDPRSLTLLGASSKEDGKSIGFFGSGFKYAIAVLLRNHVQIMIYSGERMINIDTKPIIFNGTDMQVVTVDGNETSITTRTGPKWEIRDAIREIWSNALDAGEAKRFTMSEPAGRAGYSRIFVSKCYEINDMLDNWNLFFLEGDADVIHSDSVGRILRQQSGIVNFYRRGVWICEDRMKLPKFTYDFHNFDLPESRKVSSASCSYYMYTIVENCCSDIFWNELLKNTNNTEYKTEWEAAQFVGLEVKFYLQNKLRGKIIGREEYKERPVFAAMDNVIWCQPPAYTALSRAEIPKLEDTFKLSDIYEISKYWPIGYEAKVKKEIETLRHFGVDLTPFACHHAKFNAADTIAMADYKNKLLLLSDKAFELEPRMLRKALVEEWTHLVHGVPDGSVSQQHVYLDLIISLMAR